VRSDIAFLAKCHKVMDWKAASYFVPYTSTDHLILERGGKAIIGVNDNFTTWQGNWITTQFPAGTRLKDYGGSSGASDIRVVASDRRVQISTPPCNGTARRRGISVWAPEGLYNIDTARIITSNLARVLVTSSYCPWIRYP
jgi:alpha-amylase